MKNQLCSVYQLTNRQATFQQTKEVVLSSGKSTKIELKNLHYFTLDKNVKV
jgi:hypothetical protein